MIRREGPSNIRERAGLLTRKEKVNEKQCGHVLTLYWVGAGGVRGWGPTLSPTSLGPASKILLHIRKNLQAGHLLSDGMVANSLSEVFEKSVDSTFVTFETAKRISELGR